MYKDMLVAAIKVNDKVLREQAEEVHLPFGSEYSIFLKNLNTRDVCVKIEIDGKPAVGDGVVIRPGSSVAEIRTQIIIELGGIKLFAHQFVL
jgi:hypothetical protein